MTKIKNWKELERKHPELKTLRKSPIWSRPEIGKGWYNLIDELMCELKEKKMIKESFMVLQVKEKFGGLRFYVYSMPSGAFDIIHKYEEKSYEICERCGKDGKVRDKRMWVKTLCEECNKK